MRALPQPLRRPGGRLRATRFALAGAALLSLAPLASAQGKKDQVSWSDNNDRARVYRGVVEENSLQRTSIEVDGRKRNVDSDRVLSVEFGDVPPAYREASAYQDRRDHENAAAKFQLAAGDASAREVVRAAARLHAGLAWMHQGSVDAEAFDKAIEQLELFLADFPSDREVPRARLALGRARWLAGDPGAARDTLVALYKERQVADQKGYSDAVCFQAGVLAAQAALAADDVTTARQLFDEISPAVSAVLAGLETSHPDVATLNAVEAEARLGEGFCLLASGSSAQAKTFFDGKLASAPKTGALRFGARLGLAEAMLAEGDTRSAQLAFAQVSAIDHTDRARVARALVGLSQCYLKLPDKDSRATAQRLLTTVRDQYGDTPAMLKAKELSKTL